MKKSDSLKNSNKKIKKSVRRQEASREIEDRHQDLLSHIKAVQYTHDLQGQLLSVNQETTEFLGYDKNSLLNMNIRSLLAPEVRHEFDTYLTEMKKQGNAKGLMFVQTATGEKRILIYNNTLQVEGVAIPTVQGIAYDATKYIQTERELRQVSGQLSIVLGALPVVCYISKAKEDYGATYITHNVEAITGFEQTNFTSKPSFWANRIHPEDAPRIFADIPQIFKKGYHEQQYRWQVADGSYKWFYDYTRLMKSSDGKNYFIGMMQDITERKRTEEALLHAAQQWRTTFDGINDFVSLLDLDGKILRCNKALSDFVEKPFNEIINHSYWEIILGAATPIENCPFLRMKETLHRETTVLSVNNLWFNISVDPIFDQDGRLIGAVNIISDITKRKQAEEAVTKLSQENAIVAEIGRIISSTLNIEEVYERFAEEVRKLIPLDRIALTTITPDHRYGTIAYVIGVEVKDRNQGAVFPLTGSFYEEIFSKQSGILVQTEDESELAERYPILLSTLQVGLRSMISVPLISKGQVIGVLHIRSLKPNAYTELDLKLAERVGNQIAGAIANAQLFTERKQAEEALLIEKQRFQTVSENAPFGIAMTDQTGTFKYINPKFKELFGYDLSDIPDGKTWFRKAFPDPAYRHQVISTWIDDIGSQKPGEKIIRIFRVTCKDGAEKIGEFSPVKLETGEHLTSFADITRRKEAEDALQRSEEAATRLAQENATMAEIGRIISSTLDINDVYERFAEEVRKFIQFERITINHINPKENTFVVLYNAGLDMADREVGKPIPLPGTATEWVMQNRSSLLMMEANREEMLGRIPGLLPILKAGFRSMMLIPLISKDQVIGTLALQTAKPNAYTEVDLKLAERISNQIAGAIANAQLFNERLRAEEKMKALEDQLRQAQKMEAIGRLAGGVAHDFNNLLTAIKGYSQISLVMLKEGDPLKENVEEIQKAANRAASLTKQLLVFSRNQILELKVFHLNTILQDLDKMLHRIIGEDIELGYSLSNDLGQVKTDPTQMEQVILNLAINAKDAMPSGGKLSIETSNATLDESYADSHIGVTPGDYVMLSVSDTGVGMTPEIKERIFDPFFTTKEKGKGTGLGLSIVYGIVKQSGGSIWVYSELGLGTTFKVFLPRVEEDAESLRPTAVPIKSLQGSETILVVEDEEIVRKLACKVLEKNGYRVLEASNGEEALHIVQKENGNPIHLVVTDVVMPRMSGRQLIDRLVSLWPQTKALYMSGYTNDAIIHHGILAPGIAYIQKPFTPDDLILKVRKVLDGT